MNKIMLYKCGDGKEFKTYDGAINYAAKLFRKYGIVISVEGVYG